MSDVEAGIRLFLYVGGAILAIGGFSVLATLFFARVVAQPNCLCGHESGAHDHYRAGRDCALCLCPAYHNHPEEIRA